MISKDIIYVTENGKMPTAPHWAIIEYKSKYIDGDERSRTHPGHGYPSHMHNYVSYSAFLSEESWKKAIDELANPKFGKSEPFTAMYVIPAKVSTSVSVAVDIPKTRV